MENKNSVLMFSLVFLVVGIFLGWFIFSSKNVAKIPDDMHMMQDGEMMGDDTMDMHGAMDSMMAGLEGKTGDAFDKAFLEEMIVHHQGAVDMAQSVLENSKRPELLKLANDIISAQTKEIEMMNGWLLAWFK